MRILAIETSCDETAVSVIEAIGNLDNARIKVLGDTLLSQIDLHRKYGGVFPMLAKREHAKKLIPVLQETLREADLLAREKKSIDGIENELRELLAREPRLFEHLKTFLETYQRPYIDAIAVTNGPGLEPALWVGINFAKALARAWSVPIIPVNHMEGHIFSGILKKESDHAYSISGTSFPVLALLISGGHTELILMNGWNNYRRMGDTRDDAVGEAFDKVARILGLPYPGGPEISRLAQMAREKEISAPEPLPRPMLNADNFDFSFSGLKTAVLYRARETELTEIFKEQTARAFEEAVTEVLVTKSIRALKESGAHTLIVGGGVSANYHIRQTLRETINRELPEVALLIPEPTLTTDNAVMIGVAGYYRTLIEAPQAAADIEAHGNLTLA
jgi:N6-L-threonylcarbamoyladenine synthase